MIKKFEDFVNEGIFSQMVDNKIGRKERDSEVVSLEGVKYGHSFTDNNNTFHRNGYLVEDGDTKTLSELIKKLIVIRGNEGNFNDIDVSNFNCLYYISKKYDEDFNISIFDGCEDFNGDISGWDVSKVEDFSYLFMKCKKFNRDISNWDVSSANCMFEMFYLCKSFNQDISKWDITNVENMGEMFCCCREFNKNLSAWGDKLNAKFFNYMFSGCYNFDQDISNWVIKDTLHTTHMFDLCPIKDEHKPHISFNGRLLF